MIYACYNLSIGKDWDQQRNFLNTVLERNDELIVLGDLFSQKSPDLKTVLVFENWISTLGINLYHMWRKEHTLLKDKTAGDMLNTKYVKVCREDLPFKIGEVKYLLSPEFATEHLYDRITPNYYLCIHDPLLYGAKQACVLELPDILHTDKREGGLLKLENNIFIPNDHSPKKVEINIKNIEDLSLVEHNTKREIPNMMTVKVDEILMKDQKFRVKLQEHYKNGGIKHLIINPIEEEIETTTVTPIETEDMFDLQKLKEKVKKKIAESDHKEKIVADRIFDKIFTTYQKNQKTS